MLKKLFSGKHLNLALHQPIKINTDTKWSWTSLHTTFEPGMLHLKQLA